MLNSNPTPPPPKSILRIAARWGVDRAKPLIQDFDERKAREGLQQDDVEARKHTMQAIATMEQLAQGGYIAAAQDTKREYRFCFISDLIHLLNYGHEFCTKKDKAFHYIKAFVMQHEVEIMKQAEDLAVHEAPVKEDPELVKANLRMHVRRFNKRSEEPKR